jgi:ribosome-associated protein
MRILHLLARGFEGFRGTSIKGRYKPHGFKSVDDGWMRMTPTTPTEGTAAPSNQTEIELIDLVLSVLDDAKAEDIVPIDIRQKSSLADHMVVASGRSNRHVGAIADQLSRALRENGFGKPKMEGQQQCDWVLVDGGDVIVHLFRPEVREFYNIEKMWAAEFSEESTH